MSLESILEHILSEAQTQKDKIIADSNCQAQKIIQEAKDEAGRIYQEILEREKRLYLAQKQKLVVNARLAARKQLLATKQELVDTVFATLKAELKHDNFKKKQILQDKIHEVSEDIDFYLKEVRLDYETEIAQILFG